ncbi:MAG: SDR family NAD(P)-dependent oxidoreductase [Myxococcota bacterium]
MNVKPFLLALMIAPALNALLFVSAERLGALGPSVLAASVGRPLSLAPVLFASVAGVLGAAILRAVLSAMMRRSRARLVFLGISVAVLLCSLVTPVMGLKGASAVDVAVLEAMHFVCAIVAIVGVERATRPNWDWGAQVFARREPATRKAFVSGATSGIGSAVASALAAQGFEVVGVGRSPEKAKQVESVSSNIHLFAQDISSMRAARGVALRANARGPFSLIVHCVGTLNPQSSQTHEGIDSNIATSWLSRVQLHRNLDRTQDARTVNVAAAESANMPNSLVRRLTTVESLGSGMMAHGAAQLGNDLWVAHLARRGESIWGYGPGAVHTAIRRELPALLTRPLKLLFWSETRRPEDAALDIVRLLLDDDLEPSGFAGRDGPFLHHEFVRAPDHQDEAVALAERLIAQADPL